MDIQDCLIDIPALKKSMRSPQGARLMDVLTEANILLRSDCGGGGGCGKCKVEVKATDGNRTVAACSYTVKEDLKLHIPESSKLSFHIIKKAPLKLPLSFRADAMRKEEKYGLAVDLGTTTLAMYLCETGSRTILSSLSIKNPQALYGDDVISRIQSSCKSDKQLKQLQCCVVHGLEQGARQLLGSFKLTPIELQKLVVVGNPTMIHLLLGVSPKSIGWAPYQPAFHESCQTMATDIGLPFPGGVVQTMPMASGFIGGDILAAALATELKDAEVGTLLVDLGTNGELMLKGENSIYATSCATGPAFEGATLSCGMQAVPGAIDRVVIHDKESPPEYTMIGSVNGDGVVARGICGSGIISGVSAMLRSNIVSPAGLLDPAVAVMKKTDNGEETNHYVVATEQKGETQVSISQKDIRSVQLGKAALITGIEFLLHAAGRETVKRIIITGTFGSYLDKHDMIALGMLPEVAPECIEVAGNAAGAGAIMVLCNEKYLQMAEEMSENLTVVDLATKKDFQETFVRHLTF